jgi:hypothetical protein
MTLHESVPPPDPSLFMPIDSSEDASPANVTISERAWSRLEATTRKVVGDVWLTTPR